MRVALHTSNQLRIRDSAFWGRLLGIFFFIAAGAIYLGWRNRFADNALGTGPAWVPFLVGAMFLVGGLIVFFAARTTTHDFDRRCGTVTIESRSLFQRGSSRREYALADVADVVLEENVSQTDADDSRTIAYRVVYVLKSSERVSWTPYFTGTRKDKEICAQAAREFLGVKS